MIYGNLSHQTDSHSLSGGHKVVCVCVQWGRLSIIQFSLLLCLSLSHTLSVGFFFCSLHIKARGYSYLERFSFSERVQSELDLETSYVGKRHYRVEVTIHTTTCAKTAQRELRVKIEETNQWISKCGILLYCCPCWRWPKRKSQM